jgi:nicotinate-nucleotide adenylyltransferase
MTQGSEFNQEPTHIFYGGTFDPPHEGHALAVDLCLRRFASTKILIVPAASPAGAYGEHKLVATSFADRVKLCELAFTEVIALGRVAVDRVEEALPAPNYSWTTLEALKSKYRDSRFALLLGFDQLQTLDGWQRSEDLTRHYDIVAVERPGYPAWPIVQERFSSRLGAVKHLQNDVYELATSRRLYVLTGEVSRAQSRIIRSGANAQETNGWLRPNVMEYIREHRLYEEK